MDVLDLFQFGSDAAILNYIAENGNILDEELIDVLYDRCGFFSFSEKGKVYRLFLFEEKEKRILLSERGMEETVSHLIEVTEKQEENYKFSYWDDEGRLVVVR